MNTSGGPDLARVTVISPVRRVDLAMPGESTLAEILPTIVRFSGYESSSSTEAVHTWVLQRVGEDPLDPARLVTDLKIRDGETLHLRQRERVMPDVAFDDVVDAVATTTSSRPSWAPVISQRVALGVLLATVILGALLIVGPAPTLAAAAAISGLGFACLVAAVVASRAFGSREVAGALGWAAVALAAIGGFCWLAPTQLGTPEASLRLPVMVLIASASVLVWATICALAVHVQPYAHLAVAVAALMNVLTWGVAVLVPYPVEVCAVGLALVVAITAVVPSLSYRIAAIALPALPATAQGLANDDSQVPGDIVARALTADRIQGALLGAMALSAGALAIPVVLSGTWSALTLCGVVALALLLRARAFVGLTQRMVLLIGGLAVAAMTLAVLALGSPAGWLRLLLGLVVMVVVAVVMSLYGGLWYRKVPSPVWGRVGDILEWLAVMAIIPLVLAVVGAYAWIRGLSG